MHRRYNIDGFFKDFNKQKELEDEKNNSKPCRFRQDKRSRFTNSQAERVDQRERRAAELTNRPSWAKPWD